MLVQSLLVNGREGRALIITRIDRADANQAWLNLFPEIKVFHLPRFHSDHCPILLQTNPNCVMGEKPFRFEPFWLSHPTFAPLTKKAWSKHQYDLVKTIDEFKKDLIIWNKQLWKRPSRNKKKKTETWRTQKKT